MSIPAAVCPACAQIVPEEDMHQHLISHTPNASNETEARELDKGHEYE